MNKEEKVIDFLIAHKNNLWAGLIILVGGIAGIFLSIPFSIEAFSPAILPRLFLFALGLVFVIPTISGLINVHNEIIKKLK